jgi:hypothetical protein
VFTQPAQYIYEKMQITSVVSTLPAKRQAVFHKTGCATIHKDGYPLFYDLLAVTGAEQRNNQNDYGNDNNDGYNSLNCTGFKKYGQWHHSC